MNVKTEQYMLGVLMSAIRFRRHLHRYTAPFQAPATSISSWSPSPTSGQSSRRAYFSQTWVT